MIAVLGGGESGCGSAVLARAKGLEVFLSDGGVIAPRYREALESRGIPFEEGGHTAERILKASEVVKSPGIPDTAPVVVRVREAGIPVISEIEFASRYTDAKTIVVTGSNGKTTTTTLIHKIMTDAGYDAGLAGNIGDSLAWQVAEADRGWYVIELSSFQLDGMFDFRADIALLLNITPDHLDRYDHDMEKYTDSKFRVARNQGGGDYFIYRGDDPVIRGRIDAGTAGTGGAGFSMRMLPFSSAGPAAQGAWLEGSVMHACVNGRKFAMDTGELRIKGLHNAYNAMAAALAGMAAGVGDKSLRMSLAGFAGVEHRMEPVAVIGGVEYINDSKATNVDSVWYALQGMTRPVVWIAGGTDKGNDYGPLKGLAAQKVRALICMGADNEKLKREFAGIVPVIMDTGSVEDAVRAAHDAAEPGDTVLLSPACASFDLFRNYEDRGRRFKEQVGKIR